MADLKRRLFIPAAFIVVAILNPPVSQHQLLNRTKSSRLTCFFIAPDFIYELIIANRNALDNDNSSHYRSWQQIITVIKIKGYG